jgi:glycosyltransferase involved in cell wall biosynthesis
VFIGLIEVASYYTGLKQGFDELGIDSAFVPLSGNKFARPITNNPQHWVLSLTRDIAAMSTMSFQSPPLAWLYRRIMRPLTKLLLLTWAVARYDVFVFGFATSFFTFRELPLLRLLGKKIIYVFNGSDSRPHYISGNVIYNETTASLDECAIETRRQKRVVRTIERYADVCINHPPQAHFHERKFINHCFVGHPCRLPATNSQQRGIAGASAKLRIVHAPSNPGPKGTAIVRDLVAQLRAAGRQIDYIELINRPNQEVLEELAQCDLVIDEVYSDIPLAGLGTEAAFFGKPAVVGGYAHDELNRYARDTGLPMALDVRPEQLASAVERLISDTSFRSECGAVAQKFVSDQWSPRAVASRFLRLISDDMPSEWWCDPKSNRYLHGWGAPESVVRHFLQRFIGRAGVGALQLADKPELEDAFVRFATAHG